MYQKRDTRRERGEGVTLKGGVNRMKNKIYRAAEVMRGTVAKHDQTDLRNMQGFFLKDTL